jgi:hypothetical protein
MGVAEQLWTNSSFKVSEFSAPVRGLIFLRYADYRFAVVEAENEDLKDILPETYNRINYSTLLEILKALGSIPMSAEGDMDSGFL